MMDEGAPGFVFGGVCIYITFCCVNHTRRVDSISLSGLVEQLIEQCSLCSFPIASLTPTILDTYSKYGRQVRSEPYASSA
jgi:hypothetical protein